MILLLISCLLTALYPCHSAMTKMKANYTESHLCLFVSAIVYACVFLYGIGVRISVLMGCSADVEFTKQMYVMATQLGCGDGMLRMVMYITTLFVSVINICLGVLISKTKSPITNCLAFLILLVCFIGCAFTLLSGTSPIASFFIVCCGIMSYFAFVLELTYKEFCVLGNIYLQATLCMISAIAPLLLVIRNRGNGSSVWKLMFCSVNAIVHGVVYLVIFAHYWRPLEQGFNLCFDELNQLASLTGLSYIVVNVIIFVILFVGDIVYNSYIYKIVRRK